VKGGGPLDQAGRSAALFAELWRAEGPAGVFDRARDHVAAARRRRRFRPVPLAALPAVPVLRVAAAPPVPWLGGVPAQLGALMHQQERHGDTALLYPWRDGLRLEVVAEGRRFAASLHGDAAPDDEGGARWAADVEAAAAAIGARLVHVEGAAGLPLDGLLALARRRPLVLALHDFALFCPRPNLYDPRRGAPCGYCHDPETCRATLAASGHPGAPRAPQWRVTGGELLAAARCVVYPSRFLRDAHQRLFGTAGRDARVIAPGIELPRLAPWRWPWTPRTLAPRVAFLGGGGPHKGSLLLADVVRQWARRGLPPVRWEVLGGGGAEQLRSLRRLPGVRVRGYYRHGSLGALLREHRVELALLLPQVPESFSLSLSECLAAGVPVMALAQGALAERLASGGGYALPETANASDVVAALRDWSTGRSALPAPPHPMPTTGLAAAVFTFLFEEMDGDYRSVDVATRFRFPPRLGDGVRELAAGAERWASAGVRWARREVGMAELRSNWQASHHPPAANGHAPTGAAIVYLPALAWSYRFQRPQQLARALVGAGHPVLYVEGFRRTRVLPARRLAPTAAGVDLLRLAVPGRPDPYREPMTPEAAERLAVAVTEGIRERPRMVFAQLPFWLPVALRLRELLGVPLVYDRIDFHLGFPGVPAEVDRLEAEMIAAADLVIASSPLLLDGCANVAPRCGLVPNAVDIGHFPEGGRGFGPPVSIGYVGALGPWFDARAVGDLAAARPHWRVRLAGRVEDPAVRALARHRNVELLGEIPYREVPALLGGLRALLIPFLDLPLTRAVDPVKLYEALAAGLPVVSSRLPAVEAWGEPCVYDYQGDGLVAAVERAIEADGPGAAAQRRAAVSEETWAARAAAVLRLVDET
jgi:glycosyltransferase involved in cell wall biosynthesis